MERRKSQWNENICGYANLGLFNTDTKISVFSQITCLFERTQIKFMILTIIMTYNKYISRIFVSVLFKVWLKLDTKKKNKIRLKPHQPTRHHVWYHVVDTFSC